ncbi:MAG: complex I subunit 5 family protein [Clostridiales bacterium]|nr:complex I subunit 5 family protein [Clostridiales bacterium]
MIGNAILLLLVAGPMAAGVIDYGIGRFNKTARDYFANAVTVLEFLVMAVFLLTYSSGQEITLSLPGVCGMGLSFCLDGFRTIFAVVTAFMWMMTTLFSREYLAHARNRNRYYLFMLITLGATMGVFLSDDLFTTFVFFEIMSLASYVCVVHDEKEETMHAGGVYLAVAILGGLVALMGIYMLYYKAGTLQFNELLSACEPLFAENSRWFYICGGCILFGFGAKAGMYPLHVWLPMAHPVAPAPASALLSGIITKSGIFGVLLISTRIFLHDGYWGFTLLIFGIVTAFLGGMLAVFSMDLKRTLACSSMSQLGFIFMGIGMQGLLGEENALAVRGTILHMFNHSNLKLVLFMAAGVVVMNLHKLNLNDIRGFGRKKPLLLYVFLMGSLGIGGIPLFNGYISKTLIHESIVEYIELLEEGGGALTFALASGQSAVTLFRTIEILFIVTGAMTVAYMTKLFVVLFVEKNNDPVIQKSFEEKKPYCNKTTAVVLGVSATVLPILGLFPGLTLDRLADMGQSFLYGESPAHAVHYFSWTNLKGGLYSIVIGALIYLIVIRGWMRVKEKNGAVIYVGRWPKSLDLLRLIYEPVVMKLLPLIATFVCRCMEYVTDGIILLARKTTHRQLHGEKIAPTGYWRALVFGRMLNGIFFLLNKTILKNRPYKRDFVLRFAEREHIVKVSNSEIMASVSFSLLMFGIGIMIVVFFAFLS